MEGKSNSEFQKSGGKKRLAKKYGFSLFPSKKLIPTKDLIFVKKNRLRRSDLHLEIAI